MFRYYYSIVGDIEAHDLAVGVGNLRDVPVRVFTTGKFRTASALWLLVREDTHQGIPDIASIAGTIDK